MPSLRAIKNYRYFLPILWFHLLSLDRIDCAKMDSKQFASTVSHFSAKFCNELAKDKSVVSSPLSVEFVLAMLALGAKSPSLPEIQKSLGLPDNDAMKSGFTALSERLKKLEGVTLNVANKIYVADIANCELNENLKKDAVAVFDAGIDKLDFKNSGAAAATINGWVEKKTNHRIKDLLSADALNAATRLVLVNALYFKGEWLSKFDPTLTADKPFHLSSTSSINIPMMYKEADFKYGENKDIGAQILVMPYKGNSASMAIILPNEIDGLDSVMQKLAGGFDLIKVLQQTYSMKVEVTLPKFKIETEIDLMQVLPKLGITAIFGPKETGLDNMVTPPQSLVVSKAVQKAFIEVNEEGAEAAAATAARVRKRRSASPPPMHFRVDRPALFCILVADTPLFLARFQPSVTPPSTRDEL